jgi:Helicase associated domain
MNLGFEWSAKDPRMVPWETRFNQLKDFVAKNGHAQVPIGWEENVPLSNWVSKQVSLLPSLSFVKNC